MVTSRSDIKHRLALLKNGCNYSHVGQVSSASKGMIRKDYLPFLPIFSILADLKPNCVLHATQVDRQMWRIGNQISILIKESTREVETLFNVCACCSFLQSYTHLFSYRHETVTENGQLY
jgi:hypothetical protein